MALERKPVEQPEDPGYPELRSYVSHQRGLVAVLSVAALGLAGCAHRLGGDVRPVSHETTETGKSAGQSPAQDEQR
jgi:hypothetical protein